MNDDSVNNYDMICLEILERVEAHTVLLIVFGGNKGNGFSILSEHTDIQYKLPEVLRYLADNMEKNNVNFDMKKFN